MKRRTALLAIVAMGFCLLLAGPTLASSHGDTIAELKQMIMAQQQQIDLLKSKLDALEKATQAPAAEAKPSTKGVVKSGSDRVQAKLYGQVNRGILAVDDGTNTKVLLVDNDNSSTRLGFTGDAQVTDDLSLGAKVEVQFESNSTADVDQENEDVSPNNFTKRHLDLFFKSKAAGKLSLGQGDTATNGTSEMDLSGTSVIGYSGVGDMAGGINFVSPGTGGTLSGIRISDVMTNMDGLSRRDRIRYDTPSLVGFTLSGSVIEDQRQDLAVRYSGQMSGLKIAAAVGYAHQDRSATENQYNGSFSMLLNNGLSATFAAGMRDIATTGREEPYFFYGKLGYKLQVCPLGPTNLAADYGYYEHIDQNNDEAQTFGLFAVQNLSNYGTEVYLGYRWHDLDRPGTDFDSINAVMIGSRIKF